ncbi:ATP-binding protein [Evansella sp. LMS18]|uniref:ATP-binding protein n=1 Tax=Evansella sp. LMS18 TaxID=2924033 RepID=UPI0020D1C788|nr:ATP-binding protein [Evansella sp. LMS18]UTR12797.1 ATP-binding protein [Evansella sp. LMS18]
MSGKLLSVALFLLAILAAGTGIIYYQTGESVILFAVILLCILLSGVLLGRQLPGRTQGKETEETVVRDEHLLRETELLYESLFDQNSDGVLIFDITGKLIDGNPAICELTGYTLEEMKHLDWSTIIKEEELDKKVQHTLAAVEGSPQQYTLVTRNKSGREIEVLIKMLPIKKDGKVAGVFEIIKDISEIRKLEALMYQSDKLHAVGELAAGVAHEIRNPLTSMKGFLQLSKPDIKKDYYEIMEKELERINEIVGEFLFLSKPHKISFSAKNLKPVINNVISFIQPEALLKNVEIHTFLEDDLSVINCEENQLKQVLINLLKNSMEAMPAGGKIQVTAENTPGGLSLRIKDEGPGIPEDVLKKIGQPFYTTKEDGNGLGMLVSRRIVEAHGGQLFIESEMGIGTVVEIRLPAHEETKILSV